MYCRKQSAALAASAALGCDVSWKIVWHDGYGRPGINEELVAADIRTEYEGRLMLQALDADASEFDRYKLVPNEYRLLRRDEGLRSTVSHDRM
jgi:hypothetical protein